MDPAQIEMLVQRLIADPEDGEALHFAYQAGTHDPTAYAGMLERVGQGSVDPVFSAHWFSEAANVWESLGEMSQRNRLLAMAADRDPSNAPAVEKVAQLYREAGDPGRLAQLLERMCEAVPAILNDQPDYRVQLVAAHEELARLYQEGPLQNLERAAHHFLRLADLDPSNLFAIYSARELYKSLGRWAEAVPLFAKEIAVVDDPERKLALLRDEAETRRNQGDKAGVSATLRQAWQLRSDDPGLTYEYAYSVVERVEEGAPVAPPERAEAAQALVGLAEMYDGEHAMMYAQASLKVEPGGDRALQLADYHAEVLGRQGELVPQYQAYLGASPHGYMAEKARALLTAMGQPLGGPSAPPPPQAGYPAAPTAGGYPAAPQGGYPGAPGSGAPAAAAGYPVADPQSHAPSVSGPAPSAGAMPSSGPAASGVGGYAPAPAVPAPAVQAAVPAEPAIDPNSIEGLLADAEQQQSAGNKPRAYEAYRKVLEQEAAHGQALAWVEDFLRQRRKFQDLKDVLLAASRAPGVSNDTRIEQLRDVAQISEQKLRDLDGAIEVWRELLQLDRSDEQARDHLIELLEKQRRWDELAPMLEQQAMNEDDTEQRILLEKQLAKLHEKRREDPASAAEVWVRIAELQPGEIDPIMTAVGLYEKANALDGAAQVLADAVSQLSDVEVKGRVLEKLGEVRTALGDPGAAGDAFSEAGELLDSDGHFERALAAYQSASRFGDAAQVSERRAQLHEGADKAIHLAVAGEMLVSGGDPAGALLHFEAAAELDPKNEELATKVEEQYHLAGRHDDQVQFLLRRAAALDEEAMRVGIRHRAAAIQRSVGDEEGARHSLEMVLEDQEDLSALQLLLDMAERRQDYPDSVQLLERLVKITEGDDRLAYAVREAQVLADGVGDVDGAVERYQTILADFDPKNAYAMHAMADLEMRRSNHQGAAEALEKLLAISEGEQRIETARQLAQLYEGPLDDLDGAIRALEVVYQGDEQDFDAIDRLRRLSEKKEDWPRVATLLARLIEVEGDEEEASEMTRQLASIYRDELEQGDMALKVLEKRADEGDVACQQAYEQLGIELGWKGIVAQKLVQWNESVAGTSRSAALRRSFELFLEVERDADARTVALDLARSKDCDVEMARQLEGIAERLEDLDALAVAHDIIGKSLTGMDRAEEYVRQAEVMARAGADPLDAIQHGELALSGIEPDQAQELLSRLAALTQAPGHVIDLYERQVNRCKRPQDRVAALAAAAQVAAGCGAVDRAREFFNYALSGGVNEDTLIQLEDAARVADQSAGGSGRLLRTLAEALAAGGQGSRDGGRTRSALLRRAAVIAHRELRDMDAAFNWLGDSLIAHVDEAALGALDELGEEVGDPKRVRQALDRALDEVYDGPLVRKLLRRRADLLKTLGEKQDAAADLKRLHDLSPADQGLTKELSSLLTDLGDHRGMIELYEDQILRGREPHVRAELARKVAQIWEEQIGDARETADAWRRVLRMKAGDKDAQAGLERAKTGKLKKPPPVRGKSSPPTASQAAMASSPVVGSGPPVPSYPASGGGLAEAAEVLPEEAASSAPEVPTTGWGDSAPAPPAMVEAEPIEAEPVDTEQTDVGPTQGGPPPAIQDQAQAYDQASYDYATAQDQSPADWGQASPPGYVQGGYDPAASPPGGYDQAAYPQGDGTPGPYDQGQYPQGAYDQAQYPQGAYDQAQYPQGAYDQAQYPQGAHDQAQYPQGAYDQAQYAQAPYDEAQQAPYDQAQPAPYDQAQYDQAQYGQQAPYEQGQHPQGGYDQPQHGQAQPEPPAYDQAQAPQEQAQPGHYDQGQYPPQGGEHPPYPPQAYDQAQYDQGQYPQGGYEQAPQGTYDQAAYDQAAYDQAQHDQAPYDPAQYPPAQYPQGGYEQGQYPEGTYDQAAYGQPGYPQGYDPAQAPPEPGQVPPPLPSGQAPPPWPGQPAPAADEEAIELDDAAVELVDDEGGG